MYLHWNEKKITDFSPESIEAMYEQGFVFTRLGKGVMHQTRSLRIDLSKFELSSENRRMLRKVEKLRIEKFDIPYKNYDWKIGKIGKDFYASRNADFSANKIKELVTDPEKSNFNSLLVFAEPSVIGYSIGFETLNIFHYSYPFYDLAEPKDTGLGMMLLAIEWAKKSGKKYFYLGSLQRPNDTYKLQFAGIEWFNGKEWQTDIEKAKVSLLS